MSYPPEAVANEYLDRATLRWSVSAPGVEHDGSGIAPPDIRLLLLAQHGQWLVHVADSSSRVEVMRVLRSTFGVSVADVAALSVPGVIHTGTRGEADWLAYHLAVARVTATISRA